MSPFDFTVELQGVDRLLETALRHEPASLEHEALVTRAIIYYARPFSSNEREKNAKAISRVPERVTDQFSTEECALHDRIRLHNEVADHVSRFPS